MMSESRAMFSKKKKSRKSDTQWQDASIEKLSRLLVH